MTSPSDQLTAMEPSELRDYVFARARDLAFDAVYALWQRRREEPRTQKALAERLQKKESWVSRSLQGPGNWTLRTLAELTEALDGELEIIVRPIEESTHRKKNSHAYENYPTPYVANAQPVIASTGYAVRVPPSQQT